jgi:hypothetical protein
VAAAGAAFATPLIPSSAVNDKTVFVELRMRDPPACLLLACLLLVWAEYPALMLQLHQMRLNPVLS